MIIHLPDLKDRIRSGEPPPLATGWFALGDHPDVAVPNLEHARRCARVEPAVPDPCLARVTAFDPPDGATLIAPAADGSFTIFVQISPGFPPQQTPRLVIREDGASDVLIDGEVTDACRESLRFVIPASPGLADGSYELFVEGYELDSVFVSIEFVSPPPPEDQPDQCAITLVPRTRHVGISVKSPPSTFPRPPLLAVDSAGCVVDAWSVDQGGRVLVPNGLTRVDLLASCRGGLIASFTVPEGSIRDALFWGDFIAVLTTDAVQLYDRFGCLIDAVFVSVADGRALGVSDDGFLIVVREGSGNVLVVRRDGSHVLPRASFDGRGWYARHRSAALVFDTVACGYFLEPSRVGSGCCVAPSRPLTGDEALFFELIDDLPDLRQRVAYPASGEVIIGPAEEQDPLDAGRPGTQWHRILIFGDIPPGCAIQVETRSFDDLPAGDPLVPEGWSRPVTATSSSSAPVMAPEDERVAAASVLVLASAGRYLWMRLSLESNTRATPSITSIEVEEPRDGIVRFLPEFIQNSTPEDDFLRRWLSLFESTAFDGVNQRMNDYSRLFDPRYAPVRLLPFLAQWLQILDLQRFDADPDAFRRVLARAADLAESRGTVAGLVLAAKLYLDLDIQIVESFKRRSGFVMGGGTVIGDAIGPVLGCQTALTAEPSPTWLGDEPRLGCSYLLECESRTGTIPYEFEVLVFERDACSSADLALLRLVVDTEKPVHTTYEIRTIGGAGWVVGRDSILGQRLGPAFNRDQLDAATYGIAVLNGPSRPKPIGEGFALGRDSRLASGEGQPLFRLGGGSGAGATVGMTTRVGA